MNITTKMTVYTTCILALVLSLLLTMNYFKFGNILTNVTTSRLAVINNNLEVQGRVSVSRRFLACACSRFRFRKRQYGAGHS
jgi:hypothetical protein